MRKDTRKDLILLGGSEKLSFRIQHLSQDEKDDRN